MQASNDHHQNCAVHNNTALIKGVSTSFNVQIKRPSITHLTTNHKTDNICLQHHTANNYTMQSLMFI